MYISKLYRSTSILCGSKASNLTACEKSILAMFFSLMFPNMLMIFCLLFLVLQFCCVSIPTGSSQHCFFRLGYFVGGYLVQSEVATKPDGELLYTVTHTYNQYFIVGLSAGPIAGIVIGSLVILGIAITVVTLITLHARRVTHDE